MPNPFLNQGHEYCCLKNHRDAEWDDLPCEEFNELSRCRQCSWFYDQPYRIVVQDESLKQFIQPKRYENGRK